MSEGEIMSDRFPNLHEVGEANARAYLRRICKHGMRRGGVCVFCGETVTSLPADSTQKPLLPRT